MENSHCPQCRGERPEVFLPGPPCVLRCGACRLLFLKSFPGGDDLRAFYQEEYYEEDSGERFFAPFEWVIGWFRHLRMKDILRRLPPRSSAGTDSILDVGCGRGVLLDCFRRRGWEVTGTQLSETARRACERRYGINVLNGELPEIDLEDGAFRAITFYHVLEHVDRPLDYLLKARRLLRDDGLLVLEVPDAGAPGFRWLGTRNFCLDYPHHLYFFTRETLSALAGRAGFEVAGSAHFSLEYSPYTCLQNLLNALPGEPNRLYRALMKNAVGRRLRRSPLTWLHALLATALAVPAFLLALASLPLPVGNTLRLYCRAASPRTEAAPAAAAKGGGVAD